MPSSFALSSLARASGVIERRGESRLVQSVVINKVFCLFQKHIFPAKNMFMIPNNIYFLLFKKHFISKNCGCK